VPYIHSVDPKECANKYRLSKSILRPNPVGSLVPSRYYLSICGVNVIRA
jgi:hypothetical protein